MPKSDSSFPPNHSSIRGELIQSASVKRQIQFLESLIKEKEQAIMDAENIIFASKSDVHRAQNTIAYLTAIELTSERM